MYSVGVRGEGHSAASAIGDLSQQSVGVVYFGKDIMRDLVAAGAGLYIEGAAKHPIPFKAQGLHQSEQPARNDAVVGFNRRAECAI